MQAVYDIISDPQWLLRPYEQHLVRKDREMSGDPDRETRDLTERLQKLERRRSGYLDLAADGDMSREELRTKLADLDDQHKATQTALREAQARQHALRKREINYAHLDSLLLQLTGMDLDMVSIEDRRRLYQALRLHASVDKHRQVHLSGIFDPDVYLPDVLSDPPDWLSPRPEVPAELAASVVVSLDNAP